MPKKVKKSVKNSKIVLPHKSFVRTPHHTDKYVHKYSFLGIALLLLVLGVLFIKSIAQPTNINQVTTGEMGKKKLNGEVGNTNVQNDIKVKKVKQNNIPKTGGNCIPGYKFNPVTLQCDKVVNSVKNTP